MGSHGNNLNGLADGQMASSLLKDLVTGGHPETHERRVVLLRKRPERW